jgi:hypothetical protein
VSMITSSEVVAAQVILLGVASSEVVAAEVILLGVASSEVVAAQVIMITSSEVVAAEVIPPQGLLQLLLLWVPEVSSVEGQHSLLEEEVTLSSAQGMDSDRWDTQGNPAPSPPRALRFRS